MIFIVPPINFYDYLSVTKPYISLALKILLKFATKNYDYLLLWNKTLAKFKSLL